jgi:hypothetical protein
MSAMGQAYKSPDSVLGTSITGGCYRNSTYVYTEAYRMRTITEKLADPKVADRRPAAIANFRIRQSLLAMLTITAVIIGASATAAYAQSPGGSAGGSSTAPPGAPPPSGPLPGSAPPPSPTVNPTSPSTLPQQSEVPVPPTNSSTPSSSPLNSK